MAGKVKIKQLKKAVGDVNISGMFEEMMGIKDAEPELLIPKFVFVRNSIRHVCRVLNQFCKLLQSDFPTYEVAYDEIRFYAENMKESVYIKQEQDEKEDAYKSCTKEEINGLYRKLKENAFVRSLVVLCSKLKRYEASFSDPNNLKENFVNQEPGLTFKIFDFSSLDLKALWANDKIKPSVKKYVLMVLATLYKQTHAIYKCITSPDVDVEKFTQLLINAIGELKKQPELHRCTNAFRRIEQSVQLLKDKFDDYYRDSVASENADMLVMNFIIDVSNQGGANATLAREFRTIIKYMHKVSNKSGKSKDPNVQKIFKMLNNNFTMMEKDVGKSADDDETLDETPTDVDAAAEKRARRLEKQKAKKKKKKKKAGAVEIEELDSEDETPVVDENVVEEQVVEDENVVVDETPTHEEPLVDETPDVVEDSPADSTET